MELDFYNTNLHIGYPFVEGVDKDEMKFELGLSSYYFPQETIVDLGFLFGINADFTPGEDKVWLHEIQIGAEYTFVFRTDSAVLAGVDIAVEVALDAAFGDTVEFSQTNVTGYLVVGDLSVLAAIGIADAFSSISELPLVEPALLQSLKDSYVSSLAAVTNRRLKVTGAEGCDDYTSSLAPERAYETGTVVSGPITLIEGYNTNLVTSLSNNSITISAGLGHGRGRQCEQLPYEPGESAPGDGDPLLTGGPKCSELLYTINGIPLSSDGASFVIEGGRGITVIPYPDEHRIEILFELTRRVLCEV